MRTGFKLAAGAFGGALLIGAVAYGLSQANVAILHPAGQVAAKERGLIVFATVLSLLVVVPVFAMTFFIVWKYRESNTKAEYRPDWDKSKLAETVWWGVPTLLIIVLSVVAYQSSHDLDPFKPLASKTKPLTIQVVAMQWKWLFIYPEQGIATTNFVQIPKDTPINFVITSDAPMNSFWIPRLGGQVYAMSGMSTQLHLEASQTGSFDGYSANLSGAGFAGMHFTAKATSRADFDYFVSQVVRTDNPLSTDVYAELSQPSTDTPLIYYAPVDSKLYDTILMKYMDPSQTALPLYRATSSHHDEDDHAHGGN